MEEKNQGYYERCWSSKKTLLKIKFPSKLINSEIIKIFKDIHFSDEEKPMNNADSIFQNFTKKNEANGKFRYNLVNENSDFNIKPLFKKYCKKKLDKDTLDFWVYLNLTYDTLKTIRFFKEQCILDRNYEYTFKMDAAFLFWDSQKDENTIGNFFYQGIYLLYTDKHLHNLPLNDKITIWFKNFIDTVISEIEKIKEKYNEIKDENHVFSYSPEVVKLDIIAELFFKILDNIYYRLIKEKNDKLEEFVNLIKKYEEKPATEFEKYNNKEDTVYAYLYYYQTYKIYNDSMKNFEKLLDENALKFYSKMKIPPHKIFKTRGTKEFSAKELFELIANKDPSNFKRKIKKLETFIQLFYRKFAPISLREYGIIYQELFENIETFNGKSSSTLIRNYCDSTKPKITQTELWFISSKMERATFISYLSVEDYKKYIEFKKLLRKVFLKNCFDRSGKNLFDLLEKSLEKYKDISKYTNLKTNINIFSPLTHKIELNKPYKTY